LIRSAVETLVLHASEVQIHAEYVSFLHTALGLSANKSLKLVDETHARRHWLTRRLPARVENGAGLDEYAQAGSRSSIGARHQLAVFPPEMFDVVVHAVERCPQGSLVMDPSGETKRVLAVTFDGAYLLIALADWEAVHGNPNVTLSIDEYWGADPGRGAHAPGMHPAPRAAESTSTFLLCEYEDGSFDFLEWDPDSAEPWHVPEGNDSKCCACL
jgi:hypothetical protein